MPVQHAETLNVQNQQSQVDPECSVKVPHHEIPAQVIQFKDRLCEEASCRALIRNSLSSATSEVTVNRVFEALEAYLVLQLFDKAAELVENIKQGPHRDLARNSPRLASLCVCFERKVGTPESFRVAVADLKRSFGTNQWPHAFDHDSDRALKWILPLHANGLSEIIVEVLSCIDVVKGNDAVRLATTTFLRAGELDNAVAAANCNRESLQSLAPSLLRAAVTSGRFDLVNEVLNSAGIERLDHDSAGVLVGAFLSRMLPEALKSYARALIRGRSEEEGYSICSAASALSPGARAKDVQVALVTSAIREQWLFHLIGQGRMELALAVAKDQLSPRLICRAAKLGHGDAVAPLAVTTESGKLALECGKALCRSKNGDFAEGERLLVEWSRARGRHLITQRTTLLAGLLECAASCGDDGRAVRYVAQIVDPVTAPNAIISAIRAAHDSKNVEVAHRILIRYLGSHQCNPLLLTQSAAARIAFANRLTEEGIDPEILRPLLSTASSELALRAKMPVGESFLRALRELGELAARIGNEATCNRVATIRPWVVWSSEKASKSLSGSSALAEIAWSAGHGQTAISLTKQLPLTEQGKVLAKFLRSILREDKYSGGTSSELSALEKHLGLLRETAVVCRQTEPDGSNERAVNLLAKGLLVRSLVENRCYPAAVDALLQLSGWNLTDHRVRESAGIIAGWMGINAFRQAVLSTPLKQAGMLEEFHRDTFIESALRYARDPRLDNIIGKISLLEARSSPSECAQVLDELPRFSLEDQRRIARAVGYRETPEKIRALLEGLNGSNASLLKLEALEALTHDGTSISAQQRIALCAELVAILRTGLEGQIPLSVTECKLASKALSQLGKEGNDNLLLLVRAFGVAANRNGSTLRQVTVLCRVLVRTNTHRGNELICHIAGDVTVDSRRAAFLIHRLLENKHFDPTLQAWIDGRKKDRLALPIGGQRAGELDDIDLIRAVIRRGLVPSESVMKFLLPGGNGIQSSLVDELESRIEQLCSYEMEFEQNHAAKERVASLRANKDRLMAYYILYSPRYRYALVNNYSVEAFSDVLDEIAGLKLHTAPLTRFKEALRFGGMDPGKCDRIVSALKDGHFPLGETSASREREFRLDVTNSDKIALANQEVARVLGRDQLGVCLKVPMYRKLFETRSDPRAVAFREQLNDVLSLTDRIALVQDVERSFPDLCVQLSEELTVRWNKLRGKLPLTLSAFDILTRDANRVDCEQIMSAIEEQRLSLQKTTQETLLALKGENPQLKSLHEQILKKERNLRKLQDASIHNVSLAERISVVSGEISDLRAQRELLGSRLIENRFDHLDEDERLEVIAQEMEKAAVLARKDPAAIFACLILETLGEIALTENDGAIMKEVASNLEHPLRVVRDIAQLDSRGRHVREPKPAIVRFLDKSADLMAMVRVADSKICCFTTSNYWQIVAHGEPNKRWLASLTADPLSFAFSIESPHTGDKVRVHENIGFVFGTFGVLENGGLALCLNGVYLSSGNDARAVQSILDEIESMLARPLGAHAIMFASRHGGFSDAVPGGYEKVESLTVHRLRAIQSKISDLPVEKMYDDLSQEVNKSISIPCCVKWLVR